jgi:JmjC domain
VGVASHSPAALLEDIIGIPSAAFTARVLGRTHAFCAGEPTRFRHLLDWSDLNAILDRHWLIGPRLRLFKGGSQLPEAEYLTFREAGRSAPLLRATDVTRHLRDGATLVLSAVDELHDPITRLVMGLERFFGEHVTANAYASFRNVPGFDVHADLHDVIVLQLIGRKRWVLYGRLRSNPFPIPRDQSSPPSGDPIWDGVLTAGGALYVPRGCWHAVSAIDEPSLQLTIAIRRQSGVDLAAWQLEHAIRELDAVRADLPRLTGEGDLEAHIERLANQVLDQFDSRSLLCFLHDHQCGALPHPFISLPAAVDGQELGHECNEVGLTVSRAGLSVEGDVLSIRANAREWRVPNWFEAALQRLLISDSSVDELYSLVEQWTARLSFDEVLGDLIADGLLWCAPHRVKSPFAVKN